MDLKQKYRDEGIGYTERTADRLVPPQDDIDMEMFLKIAREGGNPASPLLPVEIDIDE